MAAAAVIERPRSRRYEDDGSEALVRIESHEEVCKLRYETILDRIGKLEKVVYWAAGGSLTGMAALIATLLLKGAHP